MNSHYMSTLSTIHPQSIIAIILYYIRHVRRQTNKHTYKQTMKHSHKQANKQTNKQTRINQINWQTNRHPYKQTQIVQTSKQSARQTDRRTARHTWVTHNWNAFFKNISFNKKFPKNSIILFNNFSFNNNFVNNLNNSIIRLLIIKQQLISQ